MAISRAEVGAAVEVTPEQIMAALGSNEAIIRTNEDAMRVADTIKARIFKVNGSRIVYAPFDTKMD